MLIFGQPRRRCLKSWGAGLPSWQPPYQADSFSRQTFCCSQPAACGDQDERIDLVSLLIKLMRHQGLTTVRKWDDEWRVMAEGARVLVW